MISRGPERDEAREIDVIRDALVAADEPDAVVERIAAADLVTLTITEGAYERGGMLELLARGIAKRTEPLTVISCDNVPRNGEVLRRLLGTSRRSRARWSTASCPPRRTRSPWSPSRSASG